MISYVKYGFGKVGYVHNNFTITEDNKARYMIYIATEVEGTKTPVIEAPLTEEEVELADHFREVLDSHLNVQRIGHENEDKYEDTEIHYQGEVIKDEGLLSQADILCSLIKENHSEFSTGTIAKMYEDTCQEIRGRQGK